MKPTSPPHPASEAPAPLEPSAWVDRYGEWLYRYALVRVRRPEVAEDLVQETLLAGLHGKDGFQGASAERTWLTGILRHKILDHFRSRTGDWNLQAEDGDEDWLGAFFDEHERWLRPPDPAAVQPHVLLERKEFWEVLDECLDDLPPRAREVFARRVMESQDTPTICKALDVSATNLGVILFRARSQMRLCLTLKWFDEAEPSSTSSTGRPR